MSNVISIKICSIFFQELLTLHNLCIFSQFCFVLYTGIYCRQAFHAEYYKWDSTVGLYSTLLCVAEGPRSTNKSRNQTKFCRKPPGAVSNTCTFIIYVEFTYANFPRHTLHKPMRVLYMYHLCFRNKPYFSMIYRLEFGDRFTPACCLPVCTQMALSNELFLTVTIQTMLFLYP